MNTYKTTRTALITAALLIIAITSTAFADVQIDARIQINPQPRDLQIWIWPDRGEGASYFPGETIYMNVEATRDCFLILYNIDTRGNMRILFPYDPWDDNFVRGGEVVTFPRDWDGYEWTVDGPEGVEYVQAIASEFPINPPDWPIYMRSNSRGGAVSYDRDLRDFRAGHDRLGYIDIINRKITGRYHDYTATDLASFYVQPRWYRPINVHVGFDPWPDVFYGEIYIAWPIGGRIYIDGVYVGIAPLWVPRHHRHGRHVITCYDGRRLVREQTVHYYPKRDYRYRTDAYNRVDVHDRGYVKPARRGGVDVYKRDVKEGRVIIRDHRGDRDRDIRYEKPSQGRRDDSRWEDRDDEDRGYRIKDRDDERSDDRDDDRRSDRASRQGKRNDDNDRRESSYTKPAVTQKPAASVKKESSGGFKKLVRDLASAVDRSDDNDSRHGKSTSAKKESSIKDSKSKKEKASPAKTGGSGGKKTKGDR